MAKDLTIRVKDGKISATTTGGAHPTEADVDFGSNDIRRKLVALFERWMREGKIKERDELELLGTLLYEMIFPATVGEFFLKKLADFEEEKKKEPKMKGQRLRVELEISQPDLAGLPWEFLCRPETESAKSYFLSSRTALVLSRLITTEKDRPQMEACEELKVLVVDMLSPADPAAADIKRPVVFNTLNEFLAGQTESDAKLAGQRPARVGFTLKIINSPNAEEFKAELHNFDPHVLHYIGQGSGPNTEANSIGLLGDDGSTRWLRNNEFADLFQHHQPKLVFLHLWQSPESAQANYASFAPALIRMDIRAVVALRYPLTLEAAQNFTKQFYQSLLDCESVAAAVQEGRYWLLTNGKHCAVGSPVLFLQSVDGPIAVLPAGPPPAAPSGLGLAHGPGQHAPPNTGGGAAIPEGAGAMNPSDSASPEPNGFAASSDTRGGAPGSGDPGSSRRKDTDPDAVNPLGARAQQLKPIEPGTSGN